MIRSRCPIRAVTLPLDGLDDRLSQAVIRNGRLWTSHHFAVNSLGEVGPGLARNGIRWYELADLTTTLPSLVQSGTVWDPAGSSPAHYWLGALMLNGQGHVALGMSAAGPLRRVNAAVTGRLAGDPAETMQAPELYTNTISTYNLQDPPATVQAWGGSSSTSVDPDDDMTMWTLQQFVDAADSYGLRLVPDPGAGAGGDHLVVPEHAGQRADRGHRHGECARDRRHRLLRSRSRASPGGSPRRSPAWA